MEWRAQRGKEHFSINTKPKWRDEIDVNSAGVNLKRCCPLPLDRVILAVNPGTYILR
jgi:hypothetical protein